MVAKVWVGVYGKISMKREKRQGLEQNTERKIESEVYGTIWKEKWMYTEAVDRASNMNMGERSNMEEKITAVARVLGLDRDNAKEVQR